MLVLMQIVLLNVFCWKLIFLTWKWLSFRDNENDQIKWKYIYSQWSSNEGIVFLLMILNVNTYVDVFLERSLRENERHIGVNENLLTIMKEIGTQMNVYFL